MTVTTSQQPPHPTAITKQTCTGTKYPVRRTPLHSGMVCISLYMDLYGFVYMIVYIFVEICGSIVNCIDVYRILLNCVDLHRCIWKLHRFIGPMGPMSPMSPMGSGVGRSGGRAAGRTAAGGRWSGGRAVGRSGGLRMHFVDVVICKRL